MCECTRSQGSLKTQALKHIHSHERMANTGTPPANHPHLPFACFTLYLVPTLSMHKQHECGLISEKEQLSVALTHFLLCD